MRRMTPPQKFSARLEEKLQHNENYWQYSFELVEPNRMTFQAGQYVSLKVSEQGERRSYSICSTPDNEHQFDLLIDHSPQGLGVKYLQGLEFGAEIEVLSPMGIFVVPDNLQADHLSFVATGSGIAPFKAMIEDQLRNKKDQRQLTLHWGMRHAEDLFWLDDLQALDQAFDNFHFHPTLSRSPEAWTLCKGRVTDCLGVHQQAENTAYFLCGSQGMIKDVTNLLTEQGVPKELIITESFY